LPTAVTTGAVLKQHRENRTALLAVITAGLFLNFISYVMPVNNPRIPSWPSAVFVFVVAAGIVVVAILVADVVGWLREQWRASVEPGVPEKSERK
jgi:hypothetical protein